MSGPTRIPAPPKEGTVEEADALDREPLEALVPILRAFRSYPWIVAGITFAALLTCGVWLLRSSSSYEARAQILVTPLEEGQTAFVGLPIVRTSPGDPTRTVETAAGVASSPEAAELAAEGVDGINGAQLRSAIIVMPAEGTNVIDVIAKADNPELSAEMASNYVRALLELRRENLRPLVATQISRTRRQLNSLANQTGDTAASLGVRLTELKTIRDGNDPTLSIAQLADVPRSPAGRSSLLLLAVAGAGGLLIGITTVVLMRLIAPRRVEDTGALQDILRLPVLARIPKPARRGSARSRGPGGANREAYQLLRAQHELRSAPPAGTPGTAPESGDVVILLGASRGDGTSSSAFELSTAITRRGEAAIAFDLGGVEGGLSSMLGVNQRARGGTDSAGPLAEQLLSVPGQSQLRLIVPDINLNTSRLRELLAEARMHADYVIVDAGAIDTIGGILGLLRDADHLVLVVRLKHSQTADLMLVAEILDGSNVAGRAGYLLLESAELRSGRAAA